MKKIITLLMAAAFTTWCWGQTILYVTESGNGLNDGSNWDNAFPADSIQIAINKLETSSGQNFVYVANGIYYPTHTRYGNQHVDSTRFYTISMRKGVAIYGGFDGLEGETIENRKKTDTDNNGKVEPWEFMHKTIISGEIQDDGDSTNNSLHLVEIIQGDSATTILDGFTLTRAFANIPELLKHSGNPHIYGSALYCDTGNVRNCHITHCNAICEGSGTTQISIYGAAVFGFRAQFDGCKIDNCHAYVNRIFGGAYGGAIFFNASTFKNGTVDSCSISSLSGYYYLSRVSTLGGGIYSFASSVENSRITNCKCINNHWGGYDYPLGGGVYARSTRVENCAIMNNMTSAQHDVSTGGGIYIGNYSSDNFSNAGMFNCIVSNNTCIGKSRARGGGIHVMLDGAGWVDFPVVNTTICNNHLYNSNGSTDLYGSGIDCSNGYWHNMYPTTLKNCIVWGNKKSSNDSTNQLVAHTSSTIQYCAVEGQAVTGTGNINLSYANSDTATGLCPYFRQPTDFFGVSSDSSEFEQQKSSIWAPHHLSACINSGTPDTTGLDLPAIDIFNNGRIYDSIVDVGASEYYLYEIHLSSEPGSTISPAGDTMLTYFDQVQFTLSFDTGYYLDTVTYTGIGILEEINTDTFTISQVNLGGNVLVKVARESYNFTSIAGTGGTISPADTMVYHADTILYVITPNSNYSILSADFNGTNVISELVQQQSSFVFAVNGVTEPGVLNVTFEMQTAASYHLTASAGMGGSVSPTDTTVDSGENIVFIITPSDGYQLSSATFNNGDITSSLVQQQNAFHYSINNVSENGNLVVSFEPVSNINNLVAQKQFVFPNPVMDVLYIKNDINVSDLKIYSISGVLVKHNTNINSTDVSGLPKGIYYIYIKTDEQTLVSSFCKN